ncbi:MAG: hypothetical protein DRR00_27110 [Candidatus Parabeggiatoa sp. nov. 3]|nr:MAG: hypothetical protein DRR00_27110 [Gammaproteobacteria bacterium]RKZ59076.1 MAG: hypothetical protein DRQ99_24410 [Gammaproteobacteria bacterium]
MGDIDRTLIFSFADFSVFEQGAFALDCPYGRFVGAIQGECPSSWLFLLIKIPENLWFSTYPSYKVDRTLIIMIFTQKLRATFA